MTQINDIPDGIGPKNLNLNAGTARYHLAQCQIVGPWDVFYEYDDATPPCVVMTVLRPDTFTGKMGSYVTSRPLPGGVVTPSSLVRTAFGMYESWIAHETREAFTYAGERVFGPHIKVSALLEAAKHTD